MKTQTKERPAVLYRDERQISALHMDLRGVFALAKRVADLWNGMGCTPVCTPEILKQLKREGAMGLPDLLWSCIVSEAEKAHGKKYAMTLNRKSFALDQYYDPVAATALCNALVSQSDRYHLASTDCVSFDENGEPYLDADTITRLEAPYTVYDSPENKRRFKVFDNAQKALAELQELLNEQRIPVDALTFQRGRGLTVTRPIFNYG